MRLDPLDLLGLMPQQQPVDLTCRGEHAAKLRILMQEPLRFRGDGELAQRACRQPGRCVCVFGGGDGMGAGYWLSVGSGRRRFGEGTDT